MRARFPFIHQYGEWISWFHFTTPLKIYFVIAFKFTLLLWSVVKESNFRNLGPKPSDIPLAEQPIKLVGNTGIEPVVPLGGGFTVHCITIDASSP